MPDETQSQTPSADNQQVPAAPDASAEAPAQDTLPENSVQVEDAGTLRKKVTITVPRERIDAKLNEMFGELANTAQVPGFRVGRAPRRLIERRFGREISQDVRNALVGESLGQAVEKSSLRTVGEPALDLEKIELPETGDLQYSFEVEVAPDFQMPELKGIEVKRAVIEVTDKRIDDAIDGLLRSQARHEPTDGPAAEGDVVLAGAKIAGEGVDPVERHGLTLRAAPGQIEGLPLLDLGKALAGKSVGQTAVLKIKAPDVHPNESWRGKDLTVELAVSEVRRTVLPKVNEEFARNMGFESVVELRQAVADRLKSRVRYEVQRHMREQICKYLLDNAKFDLPAGVLERHTTRLLSRRAVNLMRQGMPREQIEEHLAELQAAAGQQAADDLRLSFILGKFAEDEKIEVAEEEVNARVASIAAEYNRRPERLRQEMESDGSLDALRESVLEEKSLDRLLEQAKVVDVAPEEEKPAEKPAETPAKKPAKAAAKKTAKAAAKSAEGGSQKSAARKPAEETAETPAEEAAEEPVKKTAKKATPRKAKKAEPEAGKKPKKESNE